MNKGSILKGTILFTDIKDFTLKSSLLTQIQIETLLKKQDIIILPIIKKYFGQIVKSIGDSYMIVFEKAQNAIYASIEIQIELEKYNSQIKFNLYKLEIRITGDYGVLDRKTSIRGDDYFGTAVNLASRLQSKTPENKIFITGKLYDEVKENKDIYNTYLGKTTFKGILFEVEVYDTLFKKNDIDGFKNGKNNINTIDNIYIDNDLKKKIEKIDKSIFKFASVAAIIGIQPVPFLDIYGVFPLHIYLLKEICNEYDIKLSRDEHKEILTVIMGSISGSYLLAQGVVGISKIGLIGIGGYLMMALNFALTYSMGKVLSYYLYKKTQGIKATNKELNTLFKYSLLSGKVIAKKEKNSIIEIGKKYKNDFLKKIKDHKINLFKNKKNK